MIKYLLVSLATLSLIFSTAGCTSKKKDAEPDATAEMAEEGLTEGAEGDVAAAEGEEGGFDEGDMGSEEAVTETAPADGAGDAAPAEGFDEAPAEGSENIADASDAPTDGTDSLAAGDTASDTSTDSMGSDVGSTASNDTSSSLGGDEMGGLSEEPPAPKPVVPLKKIQTTPWTQAGVLLNAVYLARPNDNFSTVSQKIYGTEDKVGELKQVNPTIAARKMKVGDKVYYNSPKRPTDNMTMMTFYEDVGLAPETYISQPGENVRDIAKKLLGHDNSWKELWSTNLDVESKGELSEGTRLRYWAGDLIAQAPSVPPPVADNSAPPPSDMSAPPPPDAPPMPEDAPPPPPAMAESAPPPPPPPMDPPPVVAEAPPVPAEVPPTAGTTEDDDSNPLAAIIGGEGDQTTAFMIGTILLIAALALFIIIKKRKARRNIDFQTATHTHID